VVTDASLLRPTDLAISKGNPAKANLKLGWQAQSKMNEVVQMMVQASQHPR
jgi:GDPmannose 4,6-dehydratase